MREEDVNEAEEQQNKLKEVESLKVKTNIKAGGDPEPPDNAAPTDPETPGLG